MRSPISVLHDSFAYPEDELVVEDAEAVVLVFESDVVTDSV